MKPQHYMRCILRAVEYSFPFSLLLLFFLIPSLGFAADDGTINLDVASGDMSIRFLTNIFGVVDGVLHGSGSQIFGAMFGVFNAAVLTLGTTILGYTLFVSTLRTAHEGEALGRNWSSMWIPFKSATGFALMLPKATGYSIIQIFTMWVVVQGVGAANLIWNAALDYLNSGGAIIQPQTPPMTGSIQMAGDILKAETCMFMIEQALSDEQKKAAEATGTPLPPIPSFSETITSPTTSNQKSFAAKDGKKTIYFPGELKNPDGSPFMEGNFNHICGSVSWSAPSEAPSLGQSSGKGLGSIIQASEVATKDPNLKQISDARGVAVVQVINDLTTYAQQIAKDYGPFPDAKQNTLGTMNKMVLRDAGNDYEGIIAPAVNIARQTGADKTAFIQQAESEGWIMAGSFYQQLIALNRDYAAAETSYPTVEFTYPSADRPNLPSSIKNADASLKVFFGKTPSTPPSPFVQYIQDQSQGAQGTADAQSKLNAIRDYDMGSAIGGQILSILTSGISSVIQGYIELWTNKGEEGGGPVGLLNPVTSAATLGSGLLTFVTSVWLMGSVAVFGITVVAGLCPAANSVGQAIQAMMSWFMPMLTALLILMFVLGATLAYYIPLVPYILFLFGGLGWIIGVIESIAAAPLVALGIAYPEEHEILGKAQPAVMLLANIFIRPSLMVIGFIAGISLSYVGIWLLNAGFARAAQAVATPTAQGIGVWLFMPFALMSIYTALVVQIINQAFGLIHVLPDEVLRWISGSPTKQFGEAAGEQAVARSFKEDTGAMGKGVAESTAKKEEQKQLGARKKEGGGGGDTGLGT